MSRIRYRIIKHKPVEQELAAAAVQAPSIADTPPPRDEEQYTQKIFHLIGERHGDTDHITDAEMEYIAIIRNVFKGNSYSKKLFELMDKGELCKPDFIRHHDLYADSIFIPLHI